MSSEDHHPIRRVLMTADAVGGVWQYSVALATGLAERGVEVVLATLGPRPSEAQKQQLPETGKVQLIESDFALEWMENPWDEVDQSLEWLLSLERDWRPDIVHLNGYALAAGSFHSPALCVAHSCVYSWFEAVQNSAPGAEWLEYKRRVSRGLDACAAAIAPSRFMAEAIVRQYGCEQERTVVIHNFPGAAAIAVADKQPSFLAAGRMWDPAKNLSVLQSIARQLAWPLSIAGSEAPSDGTAIRYLGYLTHNDVLREMAKAAVFVHPALYEPFGLAVLEAARAGCCLALADIPSLRELWEGAAVFVDPRDGDSWVEELNKLAGDARERERLGKAALEHAERYTKNQAVSKYLDLYGRVAKEERVGSGVAA